MMGRAVSHPPIRGPQRLAASVTEATRIGTRHSFSRRSIETMGANSLPKYSGSVTECKGQRIPLLAKEGNTLSLTFVTVITESCTSTEGGFALENFLYIFQIGG